LLATLRNHIRNFGLFVNRPYGLFHLLAAAFRAISARCSLLSDLALAFPPRLPSSAAANLAESGNSSVSSPVAIRITLTALPITSAGRFSPRGPWGMLNSAVERDNICTDRQDRPRRDDRSHLHLQADCNPDLRAADKPQVRKWI
jgi:hypothetical protein